MSKQLFIPKRPTMNLTNDDLYAILGCIDFVDDNDMDMNDLIMSHVSTNFDRTGFQQDLIGFELDLIGFYWDLVFL